MISVSGNSQVFLTNPQQNHPPISRQSGQAGSFEQLLTMLVDQNLEENVQQGNSVNHVG